MEKGEIFILNSQFRDIYPEKCYNHPFIFWEDEAADFRGIMLTTSPDYCNIPLKPSHFEEGFRIGFGKSYEYPISYIAPLYLLKDIIYEHLEFAGELSTEGKNFIESIIRKLKYTDWIKYTTGMKSS